MFDSKRILCFIGARSGSKGIKDKNIFDFAGKPLIQWTVQAALDSKFIDRIIVSTDSQKIADIVKRSGLEVPFLRPAQLADDQSPVQDAVRHCLDWLEERGEMNYQYILWLQPTSPLRTSEHIDQALEFYFQNSKSNEDTLVSVKKAPAKSGWLMKSNEDGYVGFCIDQDGNKIQRQQIPQYYYPNGAIYFAPIDVIKSKGVYGNHTIPFVMDEESSIDIDTPEDMECALKYFRELKRLENKYEIKK